MVTLTLTDTQARALTRAADLSISLIAGLQDGQRNPDMNDALLTLLSACERAGINVELLPITRED